MDIRIGFKRRKCHKKEEGDGDEEEKEDRQINRLACLPDEVVLDIISRLPIKSVIQFRFVCRSWNFFSRDPHLVDMHLSRSVMNRRLCLILHCDYPIRNQLHFVEFSAANDNQIVRKIDTPFANSMPEFSVIGSCDGLLCLIDSLLADSICIYNPFTTDYRILPKSTEFQDQVVMFGFGFHPVTKEYKVVKIIYYWNAYNIENPRRFRRLLYTLRQRSDVQIYNLGSNEWRSIGNAPYILEKRSSPGVLANGRLHWMSRWGKYHGRHDRVIVSFDLADESFKEIPRPEASGTFRGWMNCHLAVLGGCLSVAVPALGGNGILDIWVMKIYGVQVSWVKEYTVGAYSPRFIGPELQRSYSIWKNIFCGKLFRILWLLKTGEILIEYRGGTLVSYNPHSGMFRNLSFPGRPRFFQTTVHVGSLTPVAQS